MVSVTRDEFLQHEDATKDVIDVKRIYIDMAGDLVAGVLLSQIVFWHLPSKQNGNSKLRVYHKGEYWIAKKREDWWDECRVTPKQADRALKELEDANLIVTDILKFDGSPTKHVRIDWAIFLASYENLLHSYTPEGGKSKFPKGQNRNSQKGKNDIDQTVKSLTETTAESTSETREDSGQKTPAPAEEPKPPIPDKESPLAVDIELSAPAPLSHSQDATPARLPDAPVVVRAKQTVRAILAGQGCGDAPGVADPHIAQQQELGIIAATVSEVTGVQLKGKRNKDYLFSEAKELMQLDPPATADEIRARYGPGGWWWENDWRGQKGECPAPDMIRKTWGKWLKPKVIQFKRDSKAAKLADTFARWDAEEKHGDTTNHNGDPQEIFECVSFTVT